MVRNEAKFLVKRMRDEKVSIDLDIPMTLISHHPFTPSMASPITLDQDYSYRTLEQDLGIYEVIEILTYKLHNIKDEL